MGTIRPASRRSGRDAERTSPSRTPGSVDRLHGARRGATPRAPCTASGARSARLGLGRSGRFGAARSAVARHRPPAADAALDPGPVRIRPSRTRYAARPFPSRSRLVEPRPELGTFPEACDAWPVRIGTACDPAEPSRRRSRPCRTRAAPGRGLPGRLGSPGAAIGCTGTRPDGLHARARGNAQVRHPRARANCSRSRPRARAEPRAPNPRGDVAATLDAATARAFGARPPRNRDPLRSARPRSASSGPCAQPVVVARPRRAGPPQPTPSGFAIRRGRILPARVRFVRAERTGRRSEHVAFGRS
jgi:hypothetical protein